MNGSLSMIISVIKILIHSVSLFHRSESNLALKQLLFYLEFCKSFLIRIKQI